MRDHRSRGAAHPRRRRQLGLTFAGAMFGLVLIVFFGTVAVVTVPVYASFWQVRTIMNGLVERDDIISKGPRAIMTSLGTMLNVNNIRDLRAKDFQLQREQGAYKLLVDYEVREHLFFNVDVVMAFDHEVLLRKP